MGKVDCLVICALLLCGILSYANAEGVSLNELLNNQNDEVPTFGQTGQRGLKYLVDTPQTVLEYHNGPLITDPITLVYLIWYGTFTENLQSAVRDFFSSFNDTQVKPPSVVSWWNLTSGYKDSSGRQVTSQLRLVAEISDVDYSLGKVLNDSDVELLVLKGVNSTTFPENSKSIYLVITDQDVQVADFCSTSCAAHAATSPATTPSGQQLPYAWVGNAETKCPGLCAWPFAKAAYGPDSPPLIPPNADVGTDGIIINLGIILTGLVTNPFDSGYYQGDGADPLEASSACPGAYGQGAYDGYPGLLQDDTITGASYNTEGSNGRKFLLPSVWDCTTRVCTAPS